LVLLVVAAVLAAGGCYAAKLEIGADAPGFSGTSTEDKECSLADYKDAKLIALVFTCNHCPVAVAYEDRLIELQDDYKSKGVQLVAVCVNDKDGDRLPGMKKRAEDKDFNFPYIYDETQESAREYGATCTPHAFLLCKDRKIAYMGAIDDNKKAGDVEKDYLRDAIDALLDGKEPPETVTKQFGCGIKWSKK
jgi:peroxiredoxin